MVVLIVVLVVVVVVVVVVLVVFGNISRLNNNNWYKYQSKHVVLCNKWNLVMFGMILS
jgi:hypothetical protein